MRRAAVVGTLAVLPLLTACSGGAQDQPAEDPRPAQTSAAPAAGVVAPAKVEVIAGLTGCRATIRVDADQLRQGLCHTPEADFLITTFPEEKYQRTWLAEAAVYGGTYLVGPRWVVSAKSAMLAGLREKLGGTIRQLRGIGPTAGSP
ncbi:hypothetical protein V5O46_24755 [Streptomyces sp. C6-003]